MKKFFAKLAQKYSFFDKLWNIIWWLDVKRRALMYSDYDFAQKLFLSKIGKKADFNNPKTYNEKMWFFKLSNRDPLLTICSDKHLVRNYVAQNGFADILKKEYTCFENAEQIEFSSLPSPCYLKCNHASGMNLIYRKEDNLDLNHLRWKFNFLLKQNPYLLSREWNYKNIKPLIICEELLQMPDGSDIPELQFFCFNGEPKLIMYNKGLADNTGKHKLAMRWVFDVDFNLIKVKTSQQTDNNPPTKPLNFDRMLEIAKKLSQPFPHVRVDLFNINGKIYFNELTFYSGGGFVFIEPIEWQNIIGDYLKCNSCQLPADVFKRHTIRDLLHNCRER